MKKLTVSMMVNKIILFNLNHLKKMQELNGIVEILVQIVVKWNCRKAIILVRSIIDAKNKV